MDLQELGITNEELTERLVEKMANDLMSEQVRGYDPECGPYNDEQPTPFAERIHELLVARIDEKVKQVADQHVLPQVDQMIDSLTLQATNEWGEKKGEPKTFIEYLVAQAQGHLEQPVDYDGKPCSRYGRNQQTRLTYMVHKHLQYAIESAMKDAVKLVNESLAKSLNETCRMKLEEISKKIAVAIKVQ